MDCPTLEGIGGGLCVADAPVDEANALRQVWACRTVHLTLEAVEHDDLAAARHELAHEVRADEAGAAGDERLHGSHT
jgi:hypothetical protein